MHLFVSSTTALNSHHCDIQSELTVFKLLSIYFESSVVLYAAIIPIFVMCRNGKRVLFSCVTSLNSNTADCGNREIASTA